MTIFWAWHIDERWVAPQNPRSSFSALQALTKLYVQVDAPVEKGSRAEAEVNEFLAHLVGLI